MDFQNYLKNKKKKQLEGYFGEAKPLKKNVDENIKIIIELLGDASDLIHRDFYIGEGEKTKISVFFLDGLTSGEYIHNYVLKTLMIDIRSSTLNKNVLNKENIYNIIRDYSLPLSDITEVKDFKVLCETLLSGDSIILVDGFDQCFSLDIKGWKDRGVTEPSSQTVVRGPKDSFNETLRTNTMLIRRRIKDINLRVEEQVLGTVSRTNIAIMYIKGIANQKIVDEVKKRINEINMDSILASGFIEAHIVDNPNTVFPTIYNTERPDTVVAGLNEGRIAIVVDGTPHTLLVPALFVQFFHASEDYYHHPYFASFIRVVRYLAYFSALLTPSLYIAITTFHQEMIPTPLLISIASQREGIPFPAILEALIMEFTFEILREAGIRMPRAIGSALSIVGALVIGQAAVQAGVVGAMMVIIVSITAISSLIAPSYDFAISIRLLRFIFMFLGAFFGLFGIGIGIFIFNLHLCSLRSFGVPYMYPLAPLNLQGLKDAIIRLPITKLVKRPNLLSGYDEYRQDQNDQNEKSIKE